MHKNLNYTYKMKHDLGQPTLCIPKVDISNTNDIFIADIFEKLNWGEIDYITIIPNKIFDNNQTHKVFIRFNCWYNSSSATLYRNRIINNQPVNIVYNAPWYWKVKKSYY